MNFLFPELRSALLGRKKRVLFALASSQAIPTLELGVLFSVLAVLSPQNFDHAIAYLNRHSPIPITISLTSDQKILIILLLNIFFIFSLYFLKRGAEENMTRLQYDAYSSLTNRLVSDFLRLNRTNAEKIGKERLVDSIINDAAIFADLIKQLLAFASGGISLLIFLVATAFVSLPMLMVSTFIYFLPIILGRKVYEDLSKIGKRKMANQEQMLTFFTDVMQGFDRINLDRLNHILEKTANRIVIDSKSWREEKKRRLSNHNIFNDAFAMTGLLLTVCVGTWWFKISTESLFFLIAAFSRARVYVGAISYSFAQIKIDTPHAHRYLALSEDLKSARALNRRRTVREIKYPHTIHFENACFHHGEKLILKLPQLRLEPGERILITGHSGSGKSTLLKGLAGLHENYTGKITVGEASIDTLTPEFFAKNIFYSCPDLHIFDLSWRENICAEEGSSQEAAAKVELTTELGATSENWFDQEVPENGGHLSLGQRHRLLLARLFASPNKKLILLDEMTTNLNTELEERIMSRIIELIPKDAILIITSHRPPKNFYFHRHLVIHEGKIESKIESSERGSRL